MKCFLVTDIYYIGSHVPACVYVLIMQKFTHGFNSTCVNFCSFLWLGFRQALINLFSQKLLFNWCPFIIINTCLANHRCICFHESCFVRNYFVCISVFFCYYKLLISIEITMDFHFAFIFC